MNDKELLKKTIEQWEHVLDIMKDGITYNIVEAKSIALRRMRYTIGLTHLCYLCEYHYDSVIYKCNECPMEGYWPDKDIGLFSMWKWNTTKYCFSENSAYCTLEYNRYSKNNVKLVIKILKAMKKRLKELE